MPQGFLVIKLLKGLSQPYMFPFAQLYSWRMVVDYHHYLTRYKLNGRYLQNNLMDKLCLFSFLPSIF